jgi:hypothetical protein
MLDRFFTGIDPPTDDIAELLQVCLKISGNNEFILNN